MISRRLQLSRKKKVVSRIAWGGKESQSADRVPTYSGFIAFSITFVCAALVIAGHTLRDPDSFWHISTGQWMLEQRQWPHTDPFSYTFFGQPWMAKEWLSQIILAATFNAGGWRAITLLIAGVYAAIAAVLAVYLTRCVRFSIGLGLALITVLLLSPHFLARPHLFAYLILTLWLFLLMEAHDHARPPPIGLAVLMVIWANIHSTFVLGLGTLLIVAAVCSVRAITSHNTKLLKQTLLNALLISLAACITPYGVAPLILTWSIMGMNSMMAHLTEWQPPNFREAPIYMVYLLAFFGVTTAWGIKLGPARVMLLLMAAWLGFSYRRGFFIFLLIVPFVLAYPAAQQVPLFSRMSRIGTWRDDPILRLLSRHGAMLSVMGIVLTVIAGIMAWQTPMVQPRGAIAPKAAINFVRQVGISGRVFNSYDFGGYLIYAGIPTFIDGRADLYGDDFVRKYFLITDLADIRNSLRMLDEYRIDWALLRPSDRLTKALFASDAWIVKYSDDAAVVFVRARK